MKRRRRVWDRYDLASMRRMANRKVPAAHIARKLRRTEGATRQKACAIGLSLDSRG